VFPGHPAKSFGWEMGHGVCSGSGNGKGSGGGGGGGSYLAGIAGVL